uniref:Peptidase A2 domain-containing protein n=1 Tax=Strongyloides papillosus TaxID=174720 RepID=A0A0N5BSD2_STREA
MGAQPNQNDNLMVKEMSLNNYNGSLDYFIMLRNEYSVSLSQDPAKRQTLCQYFLKLQDLHIREQFYQIHPDITIVTDEELEVFINHYKKLIPITEIDHLKNVCEVKRKPGESPQTFVHRLKLLIGKINGVMSLTPSDAILLIITFINSPKKSHKRLLSKDTITTDDITREWQRFLEEDNFSKNNYNLSHQLSRHSQSYPAAPRQFNDNSNFYNLSNSSNTQHYTRPSNNIQSKFSNYPKRQSNFSSTQNQSKFGANYPNNYQSEFPNYPSSFHHSYEISHQQQPLSYHTSPFNQQSTNTFSNSTPPVNHQKSSNAPFKPSTRDYNNDKTNHDKINVHTKSLKVPQSFLTQPVLRTVLMIENVSTPVLIDGGSEVALIPLSFYDKYLKKRNYKIDKCNFTAVMANNVCENFIGSVDINVQCLETLQ